MVGKTPQVREIVYNVLDDSGERTVIAKGATTVDVGDTRELFTRTSNLEAFTTNNFSNISVAQSNILQLEYTLGGALIGGGIQNIYSPLLLTLQSDHADNVDRIEVLEEVHLSNSLIVSNNFSNITILQEIVDSNVGRIDGIVADQLSNAIILDGMFSNVTVLQGNDANNFSNISELQTTIQPALTALQEGQALQDDVNDLKNRITSTSNIVLGSGSGEDRVGVQATVLGITSGRNIGDYSIGIGFNSQNYSTEELGDNTDRSTVINATGNQLNAIRRDTLVIAPIQTDDSNTINIMGYNDLTKEVVQSTLLRGIDGNVHATTNISVNNDTILFETNGNGSFGGDIEIAGTLEVGGTSSFTGALQVDDTLEIADTSSFGGDMTIDANAFVYGQSFAIWNGPVVKIKLHNDGTGSFLSDIDIGGNLEVGGTSSFTRAMQVDDTLEIADTSSFGGDMTIDANAFVYGQSFAMYDGTTENIYIRNDGNASFAEAVTAKNINCNETLDVFNSFRMVDVSTAKATINKIGQSSFAGKIQIQDELVVQGHSSFIGGIKVLSSSTSSFGGPVIVNNTSSFIGVAKFEHNISVTGQEIEMFDATLAKRISISNPGNASFAEAITAKNVNCNETLDVFNSFRMVDGSTSNVTINNLGQSSFAGKMQIQDELVVEGHSSFFGSVEVASGTASFGGPVVVNTTSSFTGVANFEDDISMTGESFKMFDGTTENIYIRNDGNASFAEAITASNINCDHTLDVFNSFRMVDGSTSNVTINNLGQSSFAGEMQINNTLDVDNTLTIKNGAVPGGKVTINPGNDGETVTVQGGIYIRNEGDLNASITRGGEAYFRSSVSSGGPITGTGDGSFGGTLKVAGATELNNSFIIKNGSNTKATISSDGNASFGGTLKVLEDTELNNSFIIKNGSNTKASISSDGNGSFGGTLKVLEGTELNNSFIIKNGSNTKASISSDGNGSFGGTLQVANTTTLGSFLSGTSGSFSSELRASDFIIPSDRRFKTDITHIPNALEKVKQISGCIYTINDKPSVGVIAQEVLKILPETVHTGDDGYYAVSYHGLIGLLIEAVKELSEKVK